MQNIKLTIEYDGRKYLGWQRLGDSDKTIQGKIETVLGNMVGEPVEIIGSGRTDAGTHAEGQVANFKTNLAVTPAYIHSFLTNQLPNDIVITDVSIVPERFHARYNATSKTYRYQVWNKAIPTALHRQFTHHVPEPLDYKKMQQAAELIIGEHDFIGFSSLKKTKKSTVRTVTDLTISQENGIVSFVVTGDGFLYNMVRIIVGTLIEVGLGNMDPASINQIFEHKVRAEAGKTLPAQGLFLVEVCY